MDSSELSLVDLKNDVDKIFESVQNLEQKLKTAEAVKARLRDLELSTLPPSELKAINTKIMFVQGKRRTLGARIKTLECEMERLKTKLDMCKLQWASLHDPVNNADVKLMEEGKAKLEKHETSIAEIDKLKGGEGYLPDHEYSKLKDQFLEDAISLKNFFDLSQLEVSPRPRKRRLSNDDHNLESYLECNGCCQIPDIGWLVYSCSEQHLLCQNCKDQYLYFCPVCRRSSVSNPMTRNHYVEKLINVSSKRRKISNDENMTSRSKAMADAFTFREEKSLNDSSVSTADTVIATSHDGSALMSSSCNASSTAVSNSVSNTGGNFNTSVTTNTALNGSVSKYVSPKAGTAPKAANFSGNKPNEANVDSAMQSVPINASRTLGTALPSNASHIRGRINSSLPISANSDKSFRANSSFHGIASSDKRGSSHAEMTAKPNSFTNHIDSQFLDDSAIANQASKISTSTDNFNTVNSSKSANCSAFSYNFTSLHVSEDLVNTSVNGSAIF